jgi:hypothetical protein
MKLSPADKAVYTRKRNEIITSVVKAKWPQKQDYGYVNAIIHIKDFIARFSLERSTNSTKLEWYEEFQELGIITSVVVNLPEHLPVKVAAVEVFTTAKISEIPSKIEEHIKKIDAMAMWGFENRNRRMANEILEEEGRV